MGNIEPKVHYSESVQDISHFGKVCSCWELLAFISFIEILSPQWFNALVEAY
jgi:hypothetical protein